MTAAPNPFDMVSVPDARNALLSGIPAVGEEEPIELRAALGRILATEVVSAINIPAAATSAMDGYALAAADAGKVPATLRIAGTALAGHPHESALLPMACVRIMTGAALPPGSDTVVMQEHVSRNGDTITLATSPRLSSHVRRIGEDVMKGDVALSAGRRLAPSDIAQAAMLGVTRIAVRKQLRVGFFSSGDELLPLGTSLKPGEVYDSNRYFLRTVLARPELATVDLGRVPDVETSIAERLDEATRSVDLIITTGGTSVGDKDYMKSVLAGAGRLVFGAVAMKPGRPLGFAHWKGIPVILLPGTPAAMMAGFYGIVREALEAATGERSPPVHRIRARLDGAIEATAGRHEFIQASLVFRDGERVVVPIRRQGDAPIGHRVLAAIDGWIEVDGTQPSIAFGTMVDVITI